MSTLTLIGQVLADDDWGHMDGWGGGWMWVWGTFMMLFWVVVIAGAVWLGTRPRFGSRRVRAREILDERYARGELDAEEYRDRVEQLR